MPANDKPVLVYATFADAAEAERIGGALVDAQLAACVNILAPAVALYVWQGKRERGAETPVLIKTRVQLADAVVARVRALHSYANPAIIVLDIAGGSPDFLAWIAEQTRDPR